MWKIRLILLSLLALAAGSASAQGFITYGSGTSGTLTADAPVAVYTFSGASGDAVTVSVMALTAGFQPTVSMLAADGAPLPTSGAVSVGGVNQTSALLPADGVFTIIVGGGVGDFALTLAGQSAAQEIGAETSAALDNESAFTVPGAPTPRELRLSITPATAYTATLRGGDANIFQIQSGMGDIIFDVPGSDAPYTLTVSSAPGATLAITLTDVGEAVVDVTPAPFATATLVPTVAPPTITPSPTFLSTGDDATATPTPTTAGSSVPAPTLTPSATVQDTGPTLTPSPTFTVTAPAEQQVQATATYTPSYTPTTPPAAQIAPEDARSNNPLSIPLDNTASVLDFVSFPDGDVEDRVSYEVTGMNNNVAITGGRARLVIQATCFGENTDQIQFFTGGQTYACGNTLVDREVTADSDTGSVVITAVGGEGTYVQWVLTGTATRVN